MGKHEKKRRPTILYSVWRNSDDMLIILDGSADECCEAMGIERTSFYEQLARNKGNGTKYTIRRISYVEAEREVES